MRKQIGLLATAGLAIALPGVSMADGPGLSDVLVNSGITANAYVSAGYDAFFNKGNTVAGHAFDTHANSFELNQAAATLSYLPTEGFGVLANVIAGSDAKVINGSYGSGGGDFALTQGYVQYAKGNLTVIGGRYVTMAGEEVIDDSKNFDISRSFLFQLAEPLVHTGVRGTYKLTPTLAATLGVANSAFGGFAEDGDKEKTAEFNLTFTPNATTLLAVSDYYGLDSAEFGTTLVKINYLDAVASFSPNAKLTLAANADWARFLPDNGTSAGIYGVALYGNYAFTDSFKGTLRGEYLKASGDYLAGAGFKDGGENGDGKYKISEITATGDYSLTKNVDLLGEVRFDFGDKVYPAFSSDGTSGDYKGSQGAIELKAIYKFGTPAPAA